MKFKFFFLLWPSNIDQVFSVLGRIITLSKEHAPLQLKIYVYWYL